MSPSRRSGLGMDFSAGRPRCGLAEIIDTAWVTNRRRGGAISCPVTAANGLLCTRLRLPDLATRHVPAAPWWEHVPPAGARVRWRARRSGQTRRVVLGVESDYRAAATVSRLMASRVCSAGAEWPQCPLRDVYNRICVHEEDSAFRTGPRVSVYRLACSVLVH